MKFLVICKPTTRSLQFTMKQRLAIIQASKEWTEKSLKNGLIDCAYTFIEGGAISISNYESAEAGFKELSNFPARALFDWEIKPLADVMKTYDELISLLKKFADLET